jgi:ribosomal protein S11
LFRRGRQWEAIFPRRTCTGRMNLSSWEYGDYERTDLLRRGRGRSETQSSREKGAAAAAQLCAAYYSITAWCVGVSSVKVWV